MLKFAHERGSFSLDQGLSRNLSFLPYLERWDLLDISRTLYAEVHREKFTPKFFYYLLLKFENFSTSIQRGTLETLTPCFLSVLSTSIARIFRPSERSILQKCSTPNL